MARACGWGPGLQDAKKAITDFLIDIGKGQEQDFDRWELSIEELNKDKQVLFEFTSSVQHTNHVS